MWAIVQTNWQCLAACVICGVALLLPAGSNCTRCPAGTFSAAIGAGSSTTCVACPLNSFAKLNGSTSCTNCAEGYYTNSTGTAHNCTACVAGTKRAAADASCVTCPVGSWSSIGKRGVLCFSFLPAKPVCQDLCQSLLHVMVVANAQLYACETGKFLLLLVLNVHTALCFAGANNCSLAPPGSCQSTTQSSYVSNRGHAWQPLLL
jgi:hypothetical protein